MNSTNSGVLQDLKVNVKIRLSALWAAVMFCYIYGDIFSMFVPGTIKDLINGKMGLGTTTPLKLLIISIVMAIPASMVFLSLLLKPAINRWVNIVLGVVYTIIMILTLLDSIGSWWIFYQFLGIVEMIITLMIVRLAWKWPKQ